MRQPPVGTVWLGTPSSVTTQPTNVSSVRAPATRAVRVKSDILLFLHHSLNVNFSEFLFEFFFNALFYCAPFMKTVIKLKMRLGMNLNRKPKLNKC